MLSELLSTLSRLLSPATSTPTSSESSASDVSSPAPLPGLSSNPSWKSKAIDQIRRHEGEVLSAYQDHLGFWTIGVGRLIDKRKGGGISKEESEFLLSNDINTRIAALEQRLPWFNQLDDVRKAVLLNMSFQLGIAGLMQFTKTLTHVQNGEYDLAADGMLKSKWATQTPKRAQEMSNQMRTGQWQSG